MGLLSKIAQTHSTVDLGYARVHYCDHGDLYGILNCEKLKEAILNCLHFMLDAMPVTIVEDDRSIHS